MSAASSTARPCRPDVQEFFRSGREPPEAGQHCGMDQVVCLSARELLERGMTRHRIAEAVRRGQIVRARRDHYLPATAPAAAVEAVRVGGRLTCLSALATRGVFVFADDALHVHVTRGASRLRAPDDRRRPLPQRADRRGLRLHWMPLARPEDADTVCVGVFDALVHAVLCQPPRYAVATLDSALNKGLIRRSDLDALFSHLPRRYRTLRRRLDGRAQAGTESLVRVMLWKMGARAVPQVYFRGAGFVDLLVDGWLVIECDSREFHSDWRQQVKDRERDLALAARGYLTLRLTAAQILYRPDEVYTALRALVHGGRPAAASRRNSA